MNYRILPDLIDIMWKVMGCDVEQLAHVLGRFNKSPSTFSFPTTMLHSNGNISVPVIR